MGKCVLCLLVIGILISTVSCSSDDSALLTEVEGLKAQIKEDSIFRENWARESREIDQLLSEVMGFTNNAQNGLLEEDDLLSKAKTVETLMEEANERIGQLEKEVKVQKNKSRKMPNLLQNLKKQKETIFEQDSMIRALQNQVQAGEQQIAQLGSKIDLQGKTIEQQQSEINNKIEELQRKEQAILNKQRELEATKQKSAADLKKQRNSFHISAAQDRVKIVELAKGMTKKKKQQILDEAWDHLCKAHKGNDYSALTEMGKLQSHSTLSKFVKDKTCE